MPTKKPRVTIVMQDFAHDAVLDYASASGRSVSSILSDLISSMSSNFRLAAEMERLAARVKSDSQSVVVSSSVHSNANDLQEMAILGLDAVQEVSKSLSEQCTVFVQNASSEGVNPLAINKGVRSTKEQRKGGKTTKKSLWLASSSANLKGAKC